MFNMVCSMKRRIYFLISNYGFGQVIQKESNFIII